MMHAHASGASKKRQAPLRHRRRESVGRNGHEQLGDGGIGEGEGQQRGEVCAAAHVPAPQ